MPASSLIASPIRLTFYGSWCERCARPIRLVQDTWEHVATQSMDCDLVDVASLDRIWRDREEDVAE